MMMSAIQSSLHIYHILGKDEEAEGQGEAKYERRTGLDQVKESCGYDV